MAGYSGTPLVQKLGLKPGLKALLIGKAPYRFPKGVRSVRRATEKPDFIHCFATEAADLEKRFAGLAAALPAAGMLWISWPKRASGVESDLDENVVRRIGLAAGLVDVKVCAVDEVWSGLKFVRRLKDRV